MLPTRTTRDDRQVPRMAVAASAILHVVVGLLFFRATTSFARPVEPRTYRVQLVAQAPEDAPLRETPQPAEAAEEEHRPPPVEPTPEEQIETETPTVEEETTLPELTEEPARADEEGEETVNVQLEGATFAHPDYLENIIRQIQRYWRRPTSGRHLRAEIAFVIHRNGSVSDIEWIARSGDITFDLEARGAVEAAGQNRAFGPLPEEYPGDRLQISFFFDPTER